MLLKEWVGLVGFASLRGIPVRVLVSSGLILAIFVYLGYVGVKRRERDAWLKKVADDALEARRSAPGTEKSTTGSTWRVHNLLTALEFEFEAWLSMSARGLFLTYASPSISSILYKTGGFNKDIDRRYADMELLIREFNENAVDGTIDFNGQPERAKQALYRINAIHQQYKSLITYEDMVYVWSVFACTPAIFMESRWSWRQLSNDEKTAIYYHWVDIGKYLNLKVDKQFTSWNDIRAWKREYEKKHTRPCRSNNEVAGSTVEYFLQGVFRHPFLISLVRPIVRQIMSCLQECPFHAQALGLPKPHPLIYLVLDGVLTARAGIIRYLLPPRSLSSKDRLTGLMGSPFRFTLNGTSSSDGGGGGCPMMMAMMGTKTAYYPTRPLDFNNHTYRPSGHNSDSDGGDGNGGWVGRYYVIEDMGPKHVPTGLLCEKPVYVGHPCS